MVQFNSEEKDLLREVIEKHVLFLDANMRNLRSGANNNMKKRADAMGAKQAHLRNILLKLDL